VEIFIYKTYPLYVFNPSLCMLQLTKALRDLPVRIQTASKKERNAVLQNVVAVLSNPGTPIVVLYYNEIVIVLITCQMVTFLDRWCLMTS
jgi:hypothetical protein